MIVTGLDSRNIAVVMDNIQAKLLVALLHRVGLEDLIAASERVQTDGFAVMATDAQAAAAAFVSVLGANLSLVAHSSKAGSGTKETAASETDGGPETGTPTILQ